MRSGRRPPRSSRSTPTRATSTIERFVMVHDCGTTVNPKLVEGQVRGGLAQGFGAALMEELRYDPDTGQLRQRHDDGLLRADGRRPAADRAAAHRGAVAGDAVRRPGGGGGGDHPAGGGGGQRHLRRAQDFGVEINRLPLTPESVWRALRPRAGRAGAPRPIRPLVRWRRARP